PRKQTVRVINRVGEPMGATNVEPATALAELQETKPDRVTIVVLSGDMDRVMAAFIIATGAAAMGMQVTMFFTFWGLNAIRRKGTPSAAKDWLRRMFGLLNKGGAETLPLSRFHFWGLGTGMMKRVMAASDAGYSGVDGNGAGPRRAVYCLHDHDGVDGDYQRHVDRGHRPVGRG